MEIHDAVAYFAAQTRVEVGERFVHQEQARVAHDGAGPSLPRWRWPPEASPAYGPAAFPAVASAPLYRPRLPAGLIFFPHLHAEGDVVLHRQVQEQGVVLEDHREVALARRQGGDVLVVQPDLAFAHRLQPGQQAQQGALPQPEGPTSTTNSPS